MSPRFAAALGTVIQLHYEPSHHACPSSSASIPSVGTSQCDPSLDTDLLRKRLLAANIAGQERRSGSCEYRLIVTDKQRMEFSELRGRSDQL